MELINARQAKMDTQEVVSTRVKDSLNIVQESILAAIKEGEYSCVVFEDLPRSLITLLTNNGYHVSKYIDITHDPVRTGWKVGWEDD